MSLPKHTFKMLKCHFTQEEMTEFRDKLANSIMDLSSIEDEKKSVMSDYTARINEKKAMINRVASNIRNGYEHREVKCIILYDFTRRVKTFFREDSGEQVQEEIITAEESQIEIPGLEPIGDADADQITRDATCPQCGVESVKYPRDSEPYCEDCGWPDENLPTYEADDEQIPTSGEQTRDENEQDDRNELKKCSGCEHHKGMANPKKGVKIPGGFGKCTRPGGHCIPNEQTQASDPADLPEPPCGGEIPSLSNGWVRKINDDFVGQMEASITADEGREIIRAFEERLNLLQRASGVDPVCGHLVGGDQRGFSTLSKKEINIVCKAVSKADPGVGLRHSQIVSQWATMQKRFDELLTAERQDLFEDSDEETEN